jgi:four helix bundle protein
MAVSLAMRVPAPLKPIADQVIRSASSVPANLAEGHGRSGRDRLHHFRIAYASAKEVDVHLRILCLSHTTHRGKATTALQLFDDVRAMTWRLLHPQTASPRSLTPSRIRDTGFYETDGRAGMPVPTPIASHTDAGRMASEFIP